MIKKIHFNDKYPENKNIRMFNKRCDKLQILNHKIWKYVSYDKSIANFFKVSIGTCLRVFS